MAIAKTGGSGESIAALAIEVTGNTSWMSSVPSSHTKMPVGYEAYTGLMTITIFYLIKTIIQGMGLGGEPKYFGARSDRECGLLSFLCGNMMAIRWFLMMGFVVLGLFMIKEIFSDQQVLSSAAVLIKDYVPGIEPHKWSTLLSDIMNHPRNYSSELISGLESILGANWAQKLSLLSFEGTVDTERILPAVLFHCVPVGIRGLILVALIAAAMSTFNAFINMTTGFFTNDIYKRYLRPLASNRELIYISYAFGAFLIFVSFIMAYSTKNINHIWGWLTMGLSGGLIIPLTLRFYWWRFNGSGFAFGTCFGVVAAIVQRIIWPNMDEWLQFVAVTSVGLISSVIGTYLSSPTDKKILDNFYLKTRPFGFWKPFKHLLGNEALKATQKEHFFDIISLPFVFFWQVCILLVPMQLLIGAYKSSIVTIAILVVSLVGMYFFWYKQLPAENFELPK
jgi:hypothetical protein